MIVNTYCRRFFQRLKIVNSGVLLKQYRSRCKKAGNEALSCDLLVVGGGAGGCSVAARFSRQFQKHRIIIVEPSADHYYQPMFTLVGGGIKMLRDAVRPMEDVLPPRAVWVKDRVKRFDPDHNLVHTLEDTVINYKYMVVACGVELDFGYISGLREALEMNDSGVCSIYSPKFVEKTFKLLQSLRVGNAVFTYPNSPIKCAGAPLKICLLTEDYSRLNNRRGDITFMFKTALPVIFSAKYYADSLVDVCMEREIEVAFRKELIGIKALKKEALFRNLDKAFEIETVRYSMLHVTPSMCSPVELKSSVSLVDKNGYLNVDKCTLQHVHYKNVFGIGDCTNLPTSKTAAAVSAQGKVLHRNLTMVMNHRPVDAIYTGYTSCPLITGYGKCILAEFDYERNPVETFPVDQRKERKMSYYLKKDILPHIYWWAMRGFWNGPEMFRKLFRFGFVR